MPPSCTLRNHLGTACLVCLMSLIKRLDWKLMRSCYIYTVSWRRNRLKSGTLPAWLYTRIHAHTHAPIAAVRCPWLSYQHPYTIKALEIRPSTNPVYCYGRKVREPCGQGQVGSLTTLASPLLLWCMLRDSQGLNFLHGLLLKSPQQYLQPYRNRMRLDLCKASALHLKCSWYAMFVYHV